MKNEKYDKGHWVPDDGPETYNGARFIPEGAKMTTKEFTAWKKGRK